MKKYILFFIVFIAFVIFPVLGYSLDLNSNVIDQAGVMTQEQISLLKKKLNDFETKTSNQVAVLIVSDLGNKTIEELSFETARSNGIGVKDVNNGILITLAIKNRKSRIEVGKGLEDVYPDIYAKRALDNAKSFFRKNDFYGGLNQITDDIILKTSAKFEKKSEGNFDGIQKDIEKENKFKLIFLIPFIVIILTIIGVFIIVLKNIRNNKCEKLNQNKNEKTNQINPFNDPSYIRSYRSKDEGEKKIIRKRQSDDNTDIVTGLAIASVLNSQTKSRDDDDDDDNRRSSYSSSSSDDSFDGFGGGDFGGGGSSSDW